MKAFFGRFRRRMRSKRISGNAYRDLIARLERIEASHALLRDAVGKVADRLIGPAGIGATEYAIRNEVDRLDGYLTYHHDRLLTHLNSHAEIVDQVP